MRKSVKDKVVIITGSSSGIGKETAILFAMNGAITILTARSKDLLLNVHNQIQNLGGKSLVVPADITKKTDLNYLINTAISEYGKIDILINNAGIGLYGNLIDNKFPDIEQLINVNVKSLIFCSALVIPIMMRQGYGQIINISSGLGKYAIPKMAAYCATKYAVQGFSDSLRMELKRYGISVITICPTTTETNFFKNMPSGQIKPGNPFIMSPEKVAQIILKAAIKDKPEVVISFSGKLLNFINKLMPRLLFYMLSTYNRRT
jgi:hypothetical protein